MVVLKRQKKIVKEDLEDEKPSHSKPEDAYACVIASKGMAPFGKQKKYKSNQSWFKSNAVQYYNASKVVDADEDPQTLLYCHLSGWHPEKYVTAAHIVPKSLQSEESSYLFGVGEAVLSDPRNSITLEKTIELGLGSGLIVLVPVLQEGREETVWKCVVTEKRKRNNMIFQGMSWRDVDGKKLVFLSANRPARRFLYFRFVITYLHCKQAGNVEWVTEVESRGMIWASPGPYLRQSMLLTLARKVSDLYWPEAFYENTTFETADGCPSRSLEEENDLTLSLAVRLRDEKEEVVGQAGAEESEEEGA
ncbi:MAG: hypothetical protein Q9187_008520 [Circinaria calcarea]